MTTALLVVDVQQIYTVKGNELYCKNAGQTVKRINQLIERFTAKKAPVIFIRHVHKLDGSDLGRMFDFAGPASDFSFKEKSAAVAYDEKLAVPAKPIEIVKSRYSSFAGTGLHEKLKKLGVTRVVVTGFMTNFCCDTTARDAHDLDYYVDFVLDATGTPGTAKMDQDQVRDAVGDFIGGGFARVMSTREFLKQFAAG
ncbi:hydrolase [Hypericibacter terrae]|jgi:nicotinamidase-related amidase|uniref:Hydrolase n=1 Tax=Hypericibacter terrae TaxID=2602015 RepID=A0A5J6MV66_9PROT|nr:isochorismatase family cysteine hydrolase [Hypericibacter terrae]QEX20020.1 hydrolase [Hypericibacter terrae]